MEWKTLFLIDVSFWLLWLRPGACIHVNIPPLLVYDRYMNIQILYITCKG